MSIASEMKELTGTIASCHEERRIRVAEIRDDINKARQDARGLLNRLEDHRQKANLQSRNDLAREKAARNTETGDILKAARRILQDCQTSRKESSDKTRDSLSRSAAARRGEVNKISGDSRRLVKNFANYRRRLSAELRRDMGRSLSESRKDVERLLGNTRSMLAGFRTARGETGGGLLADLRRGRHSLETDTRQMLGSFRQSRKGMRNELDEAKALWQRLPANRSTGPITGTVSEQRNSVAGETSRDFEAGMLAIVREHPEGIDLAGVAEKLSVATIVLGRAAKNLLDKGHVHKEERVYYPVTGE